MGFALLIWCQRPEASRRGTSVPNVTIEVRKRYSKEQEEALIDAVHAALMEGIETRSGAGPFG